MSYTKIVITFNEDLPVGAHLRVPIGAYFNIGSNFVQLRSGSGEATVGVPTSIPGEITAIKYEEALLLDTIITLPYVVVRLVNTITISFEQIVVNSDNSATNSVWNDYIGWVVPAGEVLTFYDVTFLAENVVEDDVDDTDDVDSFSLEIKNINIDIIDTEFNNRVLSLEKTEINSPTLIWQGSDDKFQILMASILKFNVLNSLATDAELFHLYDGDETRFKVVVNEVTNEDSPVLIWQGFLLSEQFGEPYEQASFFIELTATDGIGRLKNKYLSDRYYVDNQPISYVIQRCLSLTGNVLPIWYAKAIKNALYEDLSLQDLGINTWMYNIDGKRKNAYFILESILRYLGVKLFQLNGKWFLIGINRFQDSELECEVYDKFSGGFLGKKTFVRFNKLIKFESFPSVNVVPSFKSVEVKYDVTVNSLLVSEFYIRQRVSNALFGNTIKVAGFDIVGASSDFKIGLMRDFTGNDRYEVLRVWSGEVFLYGGYLEYMKLTKSVINKSDDYFNVAVKNGHVDFNNHYIELSDGLSYVDKNEFKRKQLELRIDIVAYFLGQCNVLTDVEINQSFKFELLLNGNIIAASTDEYKSSVLHYSVLSATAEIKRINIPESGYLTIRLKTKNSCGGISLESCVFKNIHLSLKNSDVQLNYERVRGLNITNGSVIGLKYIDEPSTLHDSLISFRMNYQLPVVSNVVPAVLHQVGISDFSTWINEDGNYLSKVRVSESDYFKLKDNEGYVYKKGVDGIMHLIHNAGPIHVIASSYALSFEYYGYGYGIGGPASFGISDEIWIDKPEVVNIISNKLELVDKWSDYYFDGKKRIAEVQAEMYHNSVSSPLFSMEGNSFGLLFPSDKLIFRYKEVDRSFVATKLTLNLTNGMTNILMIEDKYENVTDYVD